MQVNLSSLGTVCLALPWTRDLIVKFLIKVKSRWVQEYIYHPLYFIAKGYLMMFKIYPMNLGILNFWHLAARAWKNEINKRSPGRNLYDDPDAMQKTPAGGKETSIKDRVASVA
jgi:hypothetical protein